MLSRLQDCLFQSGAYTDGSILHSNAICLEQNEPLFSLTAWPGIQLGNPQYSWFGLGHQNPTELDLDWVGLILLSDPTRCFDKSTNNILLKITNIC